MRQLWAKRGSVKPGNPVAGAPAAGRSGRAALALVFAAALGLTLAGGEAAAQRMTPISPKAQRAEITFNRSLDVLIDGKTARMAPGARITGRDNLLILPGTLTGTATAKYVLEDSTGMVMQIWILTDREIATPDPQTRK